MTPDLFDEGSERLQAHQFRRVQQPSSGDREASYGHVLQAGELDLTHGRILYLEDVNVSFDGFKAINNLSLDIAPGELRCIIGPNGAGKTTMMDIITGKTRPDSGQVFLAAPSIYYATTNPRLRNWVLDANSKNLPCLKI